MVIRLKQEPNDDVKSHLAIDTFNLYQNALHHFPCIHIKQSTYYVRTSIQSPFIDWYMILRVGEDASIDTIRKQYHKLALLLHPDKNKHPKAEFAFKLISQAYRCLSDNARRSSFNLERWRNLCAECSIIIQQNTHSFFSPPRPTNNAERQRSSPKSTRHSKTYKILRHFKIISKQLKEEATVIENCMKINQATKNEYPVFDPSSYAQVGYPHRRNQHFYYKKGTSFGGVQKGNGVPNYDQRRGRCESPIFEFRTGCNSLNLNSTCLSS